MPRTSTGIVTMSILEDMLDADFPYTELESFLRVRPEARPDAVVVLAFPRHHKAVMAVCRHIGRGIDDLVVGPCVPPAAVRFEVTGTWRHRVGAGGAKRVVMDVERLRLLGAERAVFTVSRET